VFNICFNKGELPLTGVVVILLGMLMYRFVEVERFDFDLRLSTQLE